MALVIAHNVGQREPKVVEKAVKLFSELDAELDKLEASVRAWGRQLLSQADKLSSEARAKLIEEARAKGEAELKAAEEDASAKAEEILRAEEEKLRSFTAEFEEKRTILVERALKILIPNGRGEE
ncbi:hypothetical protein [Conexivisphaera calida]|uniref:hypothetical protein n=1 Tax=Conexivisphaera calida TaxID=1874277 RepID=UPI00157A742F|nr:hypothetical protein [Conexivisphaera calida]